MMPIEKEIAQLRKLGVTALRTRYAEVFGETTRTGNRAWLFKRIAWRLQMLAEGDLSERARLRAAELANDADLRLSPPKCPPLGPDAAARTLTAPVPTSTRDERLPPPGTLLVRSYKGVDHHVRILPNGFEHEGEVYRSLSAVAKAITGSHCNGYLFFGFPSKGHA